MPKVTNPGYFWPFLIGCLGFGALMGLRGAVGSVWAKAAIAACAGAFLAVWLSVALQRMKRGEK